MGGLISKASKEKNAVEILNTANETGVELLYLYIRMWDSVKTWGHVKTLLIGNAALRASLLGNESAYCESLIHNLVAVQCWSNHLVSLASFPHLKNCSLIAPVE